MKITLIIPPRLVARFAITLRHSPPLGLAYIAGSLLDENHDVSIIDSIAQAPNSYKEFADDLLINGLDFEDIVKQIPDETQVVGLSIMFSNNWMSARAFSDYLYSQRPEIKIIAGGEHVTAMSNQVLTQTKNIIACVIGEGEDTIKDLVAKIEKQESLENVSGIAYKLNDEIFTNPRRARVRKIEKIKWPAWHLFNLNDYFDNNLSYGVEYNNTLPVMASRGCPYTCTFCSSENMWGTRYFIRPPQDVIDEIIFLNKTYDIKNIDFFDLTAIVKKKWIVEFCELLIENKLDITWQIPSGTRSEVIDSQVSKLLYLSGCKNITYAPESGSPYILDKIHKKVKIPSMLSSIKSSYKNKLNVKLNMIIGFPDEKHKNIWETLFFLMKTARLGAQDAIPAIFSPYPGTYLFRSLLEDKKIDPENDKYYFDLIYSDSLYKNPGFSKHVSPVSLRIYVLVSIFLFYSVSFLFHPSRVLSLISNFFSKKSSSRGEVVLKEMMKIALNNKKSTKDATSNT